MLLTHQQSDSADMFEFTKTHVKQSSTYSKLLENRNFQQFWYYIWSSLFPNLKEKNNNFARSAGKENI